MKSKNRVKICLTTLFVVCLLAMTTMALANALPTTASANVNVVSPTRISTASGLSASSGVKTPSNGIDAALPSTVPAEVQKLKEQLPTTYEVAEARVLPLKGRFLMYTYDLRHVMWGQFGGQYFTGVDNLGKHAWGIYGQGYFAGFYDGQFFWGKYSNCAWKATGLFGLNIASGRYVTYPILIPITASSVAP